MEINELTSFVIQCCIRIHSAIGPGCFEKVYEDLLYYEITKAGIDAERQLLMPVIYDKLKIEDAYKLDLFVAKKLVLEIKSVERLAPVHFKQIKTYLRLMKLKNGLLLNFNADLMKEGIHRVFNNSGT